MERMIVSIILGTFLIVSFQNCSQGVHFQGDSASSLSTSNEPPPSDPAPVTTSQDPLLPPAMDDIVCDPLNTESLGECSGENDRGLIGDLYYLSEGFVKSQSDLSFVRTKTFLDFGVRVPVKVQFNSIDVSPRSWTEGFTTADGRTLKNNEGEKLNEWFSIHLEGYIALPEGKYQFAILSDDGMTVSLNGEEVLKDDSQHAPRWRCADDLVEFAKNEAKAIEVRYWQGPRTQIAMQLLVRPASKQARSCDENGKFTVIPSSAYFH